MKKKNFAALASVILLTTGGLEGFGINFGPFDLQFGSAYNGYGSGYTREYRTYTETPNHAALLDTPICRAIEQQKKLEFIVEAKEKVNAKETKITTKRVIVEPYAFGFTKEKQPVLRGIVTSEQLIREITIKQGDDQPSDSQQKAYATDNEDDEITVEIKDKKEEQDKSFFSGLFRSHKSKDDVESLNLSKVGNMRVLEDSHFDAPKDLASIFKDDIAQVVCQVPHQGEK